LGMLNLFAIDNKYYQHFFSCTNISKFKIFFFLNLKFDMFKFFITFNNFIAILIYLVIYILLITILLWNYLDLLGIMKR
ncbi:hypothetical protein ACJX0J_022878, partial [Zea mays]